MESIKKCGANRETTISIMDKVYVMLRKNKTGHKRLTGNGPHFFMLSYIARQCTISIA